MDSSDSCCSSVHSVGRCTIRSSVLWKKFGSARRAVVAANPSAIGVSFLKAVCCVDGAETCQASEHVASLRDHAPMGPLQAPLAQLRLHSRNAVLAPCRPYGVNSLLSARLAKSSSHVLLVQHPMHCRLQFIICI